MGPFQHKIIRSLFQPFRRFIDPIIEERVQKSIREQTGLIPITESREEDIFVVGYPKSGNTWFQVLISGVVYGLNITYAPDTLIQEIVVDVHSKRFYKRIRTPMFFKSHHLPVPEYKRVIYLLRDGRDVMVSYFNYLKILQDDPINFWDLVKNGKGLFPCKWHEHVQAWLANPFKAEMLVLRYEDLIKNPVDELKKVCEFTGYKRDDSFLMKVAENASFEKMRIREKVFGWDNMSWPKDKSFVRRGVIGSYRDEMPESILKLFLEEAFDTLNKCGYLP